MATLLFVLRCKQQALPQAAWAPSLLAAQKHAVESACTSAAAGSPSFGIQLLSTASCTSFSLISNAHCTIGSLSQEARSACVHFFNAYHLPSSRLPLVCAGMLPEDMQQGRATAGILLPAPPSMPAVLPPPTFAQPIEACPAAPQQTNISLHLPGDLAEMPNASVEEPGGSIDLRPVSEELQSNGGAEPSKSLKEPNASVEKPSAWTQEPPATFDEYLASLKQRTASSRARRGAFTQAPEDSVKDPSTCGKNPGHNAYERSTGHEGTGPAVEVLSTSLEEGASSEKPSASSYGRSGRSEKPSRSALRPPQGGVRKRQAAAAALRLPAALHGLDLASARLQRSQRLRQTSRKSRVGRSSAASGKSMCV